jgi:oligopeptide transport system ATP-binding protein
MYLGKIVELTDRDSLYLTPLHPYTQALLSAVPIPDPIAEIERTKKRVILQGDVPSPANPPKGCNFSSRCPLRSEALKRKNIDCGQIEPVFKEVADGHWAACHLHE